MNSGSRGFCKFLWFFHRVPFAEHDMSTILCRMIPLSSRDKDLAPQPPMWRLISFIRSKTSALLHKLRSSSINREENVDESEEKMTSHHLNEHEEDIIVTGLGGSFLHLHNHLLFCLIGGMGKWLLKIRPQILSHLFIFDYNAVSLFSDNFIPQVVSSRIKFSDIPFSSNFPDVNQSTS